MSSKQVNSKNIIVKEIMNVKEIICLKDNVAKNKAINDLVTHVISGCHGCHQLEDILSDLSLHLVHLNCDDQILKLLLKLKLIDDNILDKIFELIFEFVNLKPFHAKEIVKVLVPHFLGLPKYAEESEMNAEEMLLFEKVHHLLSKLTKSVPKFKMILLKSVQKMFPYHVNCSIHAHECYVHNVLKLYDYIQDEKKVLFAVMDKLLWIDLLCPKDKLSALMLARNQDVSQEMFQLDDCQINVPQRDESRLADLLDHSLIQLYQFIEKKTSECKREEMSLFFETFEEVFSRLILNSKECSHLQFSIFHLCSKDNSLLMEFLNSYWEKTLNDDLELQTREKSIYYIGSLLSRGRFVDIEDMLAFVETAVTWLHTHVDTNGSSDVIKDTFTTQDVLFSAICDTLFNIFCNRHLEMDDNSLRTLKNMNWQRIISSSLNPLKHCSPKTVSKFVVLARQYQICYCSHIIENNRKSGDKSDLMPANHIPMYEPFESYLLPASLKYIEVNLRENMASYDGFDVSLHGVDQADMSGHYSDDTDFNMSSYKSNSFGKPLWENMISDSSPNVNDMIMDYISE